MGTVVHRHLDRVAFTELHLACNRFGKAQAETVAPLRELRSRRHVSTLNIHKQRRFVYESQTKSKALTIVQVVERGRPSGNGRAFSVGCGLGLRDRAAG